MNQLGPTMPFAFTIIPTIMFVIWIATLALGIYVLVLTVRFLKTGTKAFEIYIAKNRKLTDFKLDDYRKN